MMQLGWAIPSGHTVALGGNVRSLLLDKKTQGHLYAVILFFDESALIYCGYHNLLDVVIALICIVLVSLPISFLDSGFFIGFQSMSFCQFYL